MKYIYTEEGFIYLSLVMDMFAKDIVGWAMSDTLETETGPLAALKMAAEAVGLGFDVVHDGILKRCAAEATL